MSLGDRCDEIVRLIDETLAAVAADGVDGPPRGAHLPAASAPAAPARWLSALGRRAGARRVSPASADPVPETGRVA